MNINFIQIIILMIPLSLISKSFYYYVISNSKSNSKIKSYSVIKTDNKLEFFIKNKFMAKSYLVMGIISTLFLTIFNICYPSYSVKRICYMFLITFLIDIFTDILGKIKCQINDYDMKKHEEKEEENND